MMKRIVQLMFTLLALPLWIWWKLFSLILGRDRAFMGVAQLCSLWPGLSGEYFRAAFYRLSLENTSQHTSVAFLTVFTNPNASMGEHVSIGSNCNIGWAEIGAHCIFGSMISVASGRRQHEFADAGRPIRLQGGKKVKVSIGRDCWVGNASVIMADVGEGSVIAAGSVVVEPIPPFSVAAGNPARVIKPRLPDGEA